MSIISNFELLLKPIAPPGGPAAEVARIAVQGYFLEISNLETRDIKLILRTRTSVNNPPTDSVNTAFTDTNHNVVFDITQDNNFQGTMISSGELIPGKQFGHYVNCLTLPAGQTAALAILPNVQSLLPLPGGAPPDLAIRGYTELVLSSNVDSVFPELEFSAPESARVLVSAEHRGTFIDPEFDPSNFGTQTDLDFDQSAYSLLTANGQAQQVINTHARFNNPFEDLLTSDFTTNTVVGNTTQLSELSKNLVATANAAPRTTAFKIGSIPVRIQYSIQKGNFVVDEKSISNVVKILLRKRKISKRSVGSIKTFTKKINNTLAGNKKAEKLLKKILKNLE
ncbi:MAG: hypothetical protein AB8H03_17880 [Saprospiraceae bacterium]